MVLQYCRLVPLQSPDPVLCAPLPCCALFSMVLGWMLTVIVPAGQTVTSEAEEGPGWSSMRTVAQMRRDLGVGAPRNTDSLYKPVERAPRQFNPLKIPRALQVSGYLAKQGAWHGQGKAASCLAPLFQQCAHPVRPDTPAVLLEHHQPAHSLTRRPARLAHWLSSAVAWGLPAQLCQVQAGAVQHRANFQWSCTCSQIVTAAG